MFILISADIISCTLLLCNKVYWECPIFSRFFLPVLAHAKTLFKAHITHGSLFWQCSGMLWSTFGFALLPGCRTFCFKEYKVRVEGEARSTKNCLLLLRRLLIVFIFTE